MRASEPVFDIDAALGRVRGKRELLRQVAALFIAQSKRLLTEIREEIDCRDGARLERSAHTLKGSIGTFGARGAFDAALRMELSGQRRDFDGAAALFMDLERKILELAEALEEVAKK